MVAFYLIIIVFGGISVLGSPLLYESKVAKETYDMTVRNLIRQLNFRPKTQKVVLERKPAQGHCPRPHDYKKGALRLDISPLNQVVKVHDMTASNLVSEELNGYSEITAVATVGAMASMETLVDTLLPMGLVPAVVPEFKGITVGGAVQGLAAESSSAKYGFFHDIVVGFDVLLTNGTRLTCSKYENTELFRALPGSFGSIAVLVGAQVLCIKADPYVTVKVAHYHSVSDVVSAMALEHDKLLMAPMDISTDLDVSSSSPSSSSLSSIEPPLFIEGFGFTQNKFISVTARFSKSLGDDTKLLLRCNVYGGRWFFNQVRVLANGASRVYPTKDYLFRHDRGSFWMASYRIPQPIGRVMGKLLDSTAMFQLATALPWLFPKRQICLQDFMLPRSRVVSFFNKLEEQLDLWPMWLLPMRNVDSARIGSLFAQPADVDGHLINVGAYGIPRKAYDFIPANMHMETLLQEHGGRKVFYSHSFYSRETFYQKLYDGEAYMEMRRRYGASPALPEIYDKVVTKNGKL